MTFKYTIIKRIYSLLTILLLSSGFQTICSQTNIYEINGHISTVMAGDIYLITSSIDKKYYGDNLVIKDSSKIIGGKFRFIRKIDSKSIYPFRFFIKNAKISGETGIVFLESKNQVVFIDSIDEYISPVIVNSKVQNEMIKEYDLYFTNIINQGRLLDSFDEELYKKFGNNIPAQEENDYINKCNALISLGDSTLLSYTITHRDSYVALWKLIERFANYGYKNEYYNTYNLLSSKIHESASAKILFQDLQATKRLSPGNKFPDLFLTDTTLKKRQVIFQESSSKFMLIDFWFSNCYPCLKQFPEYKRISNLYSSDDFVIIGISVDKSSELQKWKKVIIKERLMWKQLLDKDGLIADQYLIKSFPTNFLIDQKGRIIKKNITSSELEIFLQQNLSKITQYDKILIDPD